MNQIFERITQNIADHGYSVVENALPKALALALQNEFQTLDKNSFKAAGIGRGEAHQKGLDIRSDKIHWIDKESDAGALWLTWAEGLQQYLNRALYLGLFSFESHFASYGINDFYKKHLDAFKGQSNRKLSLVTYLNDSWENKDAGELVIFGRENKEITRVLPKLGTVVVFLSEDFPHEVLPANRSRASIAGWFRVNNSVGGQIDPPR